MAGTGLGARGAQAGGRGGRGGAYFALVVVQLSFAGLPIAVKLTGGTVGPLGMALLRVIAGAIVLLALSHLVTRAPLPSRREMFAFAGLSLLGVVLNQALFLTGLQFTSAIEATLLITTIPVFTLIAAVALKHERLTATKGFGVLLAFTGAALLVARNGLELKLDHLIGDLLVITNAACYGVYLVLARPYMQKHAPVTVIGWVFALGVLFLLPLGFLQVKDGAFGAMTPTQLWALAYVLFFGTVLAYGLNSVVLRILPSTTVASFIYLQPFGTAVFAILLLGEALTWPLAVGGALIFGGVVLANARARA